jgi:adenylyltransferase/sulfurtransferase
LTGADPDAETVRARDLVPGYDVVVDATDRFAARYALNDACVATDTPLVYGAVDRTEGHVATFATDDGPCYRCLFPDADGAGRDCATAGVIGPVPGVIGALQATEAMKHLLGVGTPLAGRLLVYDALALDFETVEIAPAPDCPACGP